jgi:hypothetical protein
VLGRVLAARRVLRLMLGGSSAMAPPVLPSANAPFPVACLDVRSGEQWKAAAAAGGAPPLQPLIQSFPALVNLSVALPFRDVDVLSDFSGGTPQCSGCCVRLSVDRTRRPSGC